MSKNAASLVEEHIRKAKTWNMVALVFAIISLVITLIGMPTLLNPNRETFEKLGSYGKEMLVYYDNPMVKGFSILGLIISIALVVLYFLNNKKLSSGQLAPKYPYYLYIGWTVVNLVISQLILPIPQMEVEGVQIGMVTIISGFIFRIIVALPAILAIYHLFKAEPE